MILLLGRLPPAPPPAPPVAVSAVDGDTLRLPDGSRVRLPGVDTPEVGRPYAEEAHAFTAAFVARGEVRLVPADGARDRYGRRLADVEVDGVSLSRALVAQGLAWTYVERETDLLEVQRRAIRERRGVHADLDAMADRRYVVGARRFHAADCPALGDASKERPWGTGPAPLLEQGLSPCRTCLPWPPAWPALFPGDG